MFGKRDETFGTYVYSTVTCAIFWYTFATLDETSKTLKTL
jgi:hypothetical protein